MVPNAIARGLLRRPRARSGLAAMGSPRKAQGLKT